jgi:hypothetical protein
LAGSSGITSTTWTSTPPRVGAERLAALRFAFVSFRRTAAAGGLDVDYLPPRQLAGVVAFLRRQLAPRATVDEAAEAMATAPAMEGPKNALPSLLEGLYGFPGGEGPLPSLSAPKPFRVRRGRPKRRG